MAKVEANKIMVGPPCIPSCTHNDTGIEGKAVIPSIMHQLVDEERMGSVAELSNQALWPSTFYLVSNCIQWHQYQSTDNFIKWMHAICISTHTRKCYPACVLCIHSSPSYAFCANFMLLIYNAKVLQCTHDILQNFLSPLILPLLSPFRRILLRQCFHFINTYHAIIYSKKTNNQPGIERVQACTR